MEPGPATAPQERNTLLVHPYVTEPGAQNQCTLPPESRLPQFTKASSLILSRMKSGLCDPENSCHNGEICEGETKGFSVDNLTLPLPLPEDKASPSVSEVEYVYDNDDSFETAGVDFAQESIPFRPPYEPIAEDDTATDVPAELTREEVIEGQRQAWLDGLPDGVKPAKPELVGFAAGTEVSESALTSYFYGKSKTDLLNILSFSEQLNPQLLVDLFVSVAKRHPELPIFDAPDWEEKVREQEAIKAAAYAAAQARARAHQRPRHGHTLLNPRMRQKRKGVRKIVKIAATTESAEKTIVVQEEESEEEELLPPTWPKAGEGLYAQLAPEDEDTLYLADEGDDEAFSHFMVDGLGNLTALAAC
ncbi:hypothetical protein NLG97_g10285 [Lecanicillium saksenae]|uniref:Uncharacterized protein n=1 Tax=Lecanicillium saksenae TaxID=468837 RepID=A0ACC1QDT7_9HYPO|nr:hypothetical protein NLG97_g10285 [Lecanicillium saksenae]